MWVSFSSLTAPLPWPIYLQELDASAVPMDILKGNPNLSHSLQETPRQRTICYFSRKNLHVACRRLRTGQNSPPFMQNMHLLLQEIQSHWWKYHPRMQSQLCTHHQCLLLTYTINTLPHPKLTSLPLWLFSSGCCAILLFSFTLLIAFCTLVFKLKIIKFPYIPF